MAKRLSLSARLGETALLNKNLTAFAFIELLADKFSLLLSSARNQNFALACVVVAYQRISGASQHYKKRASIFWDNIPCHAEA
ncbi:MAG: hypothetical protein LBE81_10450 [Azonexus sp.]|uniref:hypothetical protein n=1 Tax=Azonexus sp. TaxID=1872668 RepID=UPI00281B7FA4|nr:hypothetical protein [Azonexus sp.]MDR0777039.1 hypothetical protein [Azonexus sp.]